MFGRRSATEPPEEDPAVVEIEAILERAAIRSPSGDWRGRALHVVSICACVTIEASPGWTLFDTPDGVGWLRWPDGLPDPDFVQVPLHAGGHAAPADVLAWLKGESADPWGAVGSGFGDTAAIINLQRRFAGA